MRKNKFLLAFLALVLMLNILSFPALAEDNKVLVVPIENTIEKGLESFVERAIEKAEQEKIPYILFKIDTPGGRIDAAVEIANKISKTRVKCLALIEARAISAGSLIALSCDQIAMQKAATFGDAEPYIGDEFAGEKILSDWRGKLEAAAETKGRDPKIAAAFADRDIVIDGVIEENKLLTLTPEKALELGMIDFIVENQDDFLRDLGIKDAEIIIAELSMSEKIARFATNPFVAPLLLTLGLAGVIIEVLTAGFGFVGLAGLLSLSLFFGGHLIAGFSGWGSILLFIVGLILLLIEIFVPGFGVFGVSGIAALVLSVLLVSTSLKQALISLTIAMIGTIILIIISLKVMKRRGILKRLVLGSKLKTEEGYLPISEDFKQYIGQKAVAKTDLRPAGTVALEDGRRLDVVTLGEFIAKDSEVRILRVEGSKIVVEKN